MGTEIALSDRTTSTSSREVEPKALNHGLRMVRPVVNLVNTASDKLRNRPSHHLTDEEENEALAKADQSPRQRDWRRVFMSESQDDDWTKLMMQQLRQYAASTLDDHTLAVSEMSCRQTICRMHLQFEDQFDAEAFREAMREPTFQYEFQSLDPDFRGDGFDRSDHTYEVMIQRPRPEGLPSNDSVIVEDPSKAGSIAHAKAGHGTEPPTIISGTEG